MRSGDYPLALALGAAGALLSVLAVPAIARAATPPVRIACPKELPADTVVMRERSDGWVQAAPGGRRLDEWGLLTGAPDGETYLVPDRPGAKRGSEKWSFHIPHDHQHWVYCSYGSVLLARRISADTKQCVVSHAKAGSVPVFACE